MKLKIFLFSMFLFVISSIPVFAMDSQQLIDILNSSTVSVGSKYILVSEYNFTQVPIEGYEILTLYVFPSDSNITNYDINQKVSDKAGSRHILYSDIGYSQGGIASNYPFTIFSDGSFKYRKAKIIIEGIKTAEIISVPPPFNPAPYQNIDGLKILQPLQDGFKDNTSLFNFTIAYNIPTTKTNISDLQFRVIPQHGYIEGQAPSFQSLEGAIINGRAMGSIKFSLPLPVGSNAISFSLEDKYFASRLIERVEGIVDVDGDGIDDRTNLPTEWGDGTVPTDPVTAFNTVLNNISGFSMFISKLFLFLPLEIRIMFSTVCVFIVGLMVKRAIL